MIDSADVPSSTLIRQAEILRHPVLAQQTLASFGRVEALWMYPQVNRVLGIICKPGLFGSSRLVFKLPQIIGVPEHSAKAQILVRGEPEETVVDKVQQLESLIDMPVYSEAGASIGRITDCLFDLNNGVIIRYLLVPDGQLPSLVTGLTEGIYLLSPKQIRSFSRQRVLINVERVDDLRLYDEGLRLKLAQMSAMLKQDYWDGATEEWQSLARHVQLIMAQARTTLMTFAEKAKDKVQDLSQNLSQTVSDKVERVNEVIVQEASNQASDSANAGPFTPWEKNSDVSEEEAVESWDDAAPWDDWHDDNASYGAMDDRARTSAELQRSERAMVDVAKGKARSNTPKDSLEAKPDSTQSASKSDLESDAEFDVNDPWID